MKLSLFFLLAVPLILDAQTGRVFDNFYLKSQILNMDRKYAVYLPPDYEYSQRSYPVLYLLHGSGGNQASWIHFGEVQYITDKAIKEGRATPMIIIMPDASSGQIGYSNKAAGDWRYEDFFFQEFLPQVEKMYRIKKDRRFRAISGLSLGGGASFFYALRYPELFSASCPLSANTGPMTLEDMRKSLSRDNQQLSDTAISTFFRQYSVLELINYIPDSVQKTIRWYIDCGDDDFTFEGNSLVHIAFRKKGIPHEFRIRDGAHNWTYWRTSLPDVLQFVSMGFHQH